MDIILVVLLVLLVGIVSSILYLNLKSKPKDDNVKTSGADARHLSAN